MTRQPTASGHGFRITRDRLAALAKEAVSQGETATVVSQQFSEAAGFLEQLALSDPEKDDITTWMLWQLMRTSFLIGSWTQVSQEDRDLFEAGKRSGVQPAHRERRRKRSERDAVVDRVASAHVAKNGLWKLSALGLAKKLTGEINAQLGAAGLAPLRDTAIRSRLIPYIEPKKTKA